MSLFKKPVEEETQVDNSAELLNSIEELKRSQEQLMNQMNTLKEENVRLVKETKEAEVNNKLQNYAKVFNCESNDSGSLEDKLWNLLEAASNQLESIKQSVTGNPAGELPEDSMTDEPEKKIDTMDKAFESVGKETGLKGAELVKEVENRHPEFFKIDLKGE